MSNCKPDRFYLTLPMSAAPFRYYRRSTSNRPDPPVQATINHQIFPYRHTYKLSTFDESGELHWFIIRNRRGWFNPPFPDDFILTEQSVYQNGVSAVMLKQGEHLWGFDVTLKASDPCELSTILAFEAAHILSADLATVVPVDQEAYLLGDPFGTPNPWTITVEKCLDGEYIRFHRDIIHSWLVNDTLLGDMNYIETEWEMKSEQSQWYGDLETVSSVLTNDITAPPIPASDLDTPKMHRSASFAYNGTARAPFQLYIGWLPDIGTNELTSIALVDETIQSPLIPSTGRWVRFKHNEWPSGGWSYPAGSQFIFDSETRTLKNQFGATLTDDLHLESTPDSTQNWQRFQLMPGHTYHWVFESLNPGTNIHPAISVDTLDYRPRYAGI